MGIWGVGGWNGMVGCSLDGVVPLHRIVDSALLGQLAGAAAQSGSSKKLSNGWVHDGPCMPAQQLYRWHYYYLLYILMYIIFVNCLNCLRSSAAGGCTCDGRA